MKFKQSYEAMKASKKEIAAQKLIKNIKLEKPIVTMSGNVMWGTKK